jgi:cell division initiation protein
VKLTALDIRERQFRRAMRGYLGADVRAFLEELAEELERLLGENIALAERYQAMDEEREHYRTLDQTLRSTLVVAERSAEELRKTARREAELARSEAALTARQASLRDWPTPRRQRLSNSQVVCVLAQLRSASRPAALASFG